MFGAREIDMGILQCDRLAILYQTTLLASTYPRSQWLPVTCYVLQHLRWVHWEIKVGGAVGLVKEEWEPEEDRESCDHYRAVVHGLEKLWHMTEVDIHMLWHIAVVIYSTFPISTPI